MNWQNPSCDEEYFLEAHQHIMDHSAPWTTKSCNNKWKYNQTVYILPLKTEPNQWKLQLAVKMGFFDKTNNSMIVTAFKQLTEWNT